ncbi:MAG TPA: triose-phosphate isomerase [Candidatus Paceibacterota bacterium]|jgi:triosephosphate isomerase|nr:triose-phosphate isomerase [Candidatus Paceibacterota bacterium]
MHLIVGNWKAAPEKTKDALVLAKATRALAKKNKKVSVIVCAPFVHISTVATAFPYHVGAQGVSPSADVPHTGTVTAGMLKSLGVSYCIVGHSESRARGETNEMVRDEILRLIEKKITPIVCIGEKKRDTQGWYLSEIKDQLESFLRVIPRAALPKIVLAYEPVWAVGAKALREATPAECHEMTIYIRKVITDTFDQASANKTRILYGGSVDETNANDFLAHGGVQGLLVGRQSLQPKHFEALVRSLV